MYKKTVLFSGYQQSDILFTIFDKNTTHALINLTESIRKTLDEGSFSCGLFVDLQKAFDTVDHKIIRHKLEFYRIWCM